MEKSYFLEHNTFVFELKGNIFPKGYQLYNVGFGDAQEDFKIYPCNHHWSDLTKSNYYELCGKTENDGRRDCWFKNKWGKTPPVGVPYTGLNSTRYYLPNSHCGGDWSNPEARIPLPAKSFSNTAYSTYCNTVSNKLKSEFDSFPLNENRAYKRFIAYAVGDILDPKDFSSQADDLDGWRINGTGFLEHCNDPFNEEHDSVFKCDRNHPMKTTEDNNQNYCHGVIPIPF